MVQSLRRRGQRVAVPMNAEQALAVEVGQFVDISMHNRVTDAVGTDDQD